VPSDESPPQRDGAPNEADLAAPSDAEGRIDFDGALGNADGAGYGVDRAGYGVDGEWSMVPSGFATARDGVQVAYYELGGKGRPLVLVHATGFCGPVLAPLGARLTDTYRCVIIDLRAHGRSGFPSDGDLDWHGFAADVLAVVDELRLEEPVAFGHSCGGAAILLAEQDRPGTFRALYCFEPVVFPGEGLTSRRAEGNPLSVVALRRRTSFASRDNALGHYAGKPPFDAFSAAVLAAYVDNGFSKSSNGALHIRCRPEAEAQIYALSLAHDGFARLGEVGCPVTLACGRYSDSFNEELLSVVGRRIRLGHVVVLPGVGHFGPLEQPSHVASSIRARIPPSDTTRT
jgi:pimeloyl-ACP methyl ester carboxylesterase